MLCIFCVFLELCFLCVFCFERYFVCWRMKKHACRNCCSIVTPALGSKIDSHSQYVMHTPCKIELIESNCQYVDVNVSNCTLTGTFDSKWTCGFWGHHGSKKSGELLALRGISLKLSILPQPCAVRPNSMLASCSTIFVSLKQNTKPLTAAICVLLHGGHEIV